MSELNVLLPAMVWSVVRSTKLPDVAVLTAVVTKAVVAIAVELSPAVAVGAKGVPVSVGETIFAFNAMSVTLVAISVALVAMSVTLVAMSVVLVVMLVVMLVVLMVVLMDYLLVENLVVMLVVLMVDMMVGNLADLMADLMDYLLVD